jgi:hypothetical protein
MMCAFSNQNRRRITAKLALLYPQSKEFDTYKVRSVPLSRDPFRGDLINYADPYVTGLNDYLTLNKGIRAHFIVNRKLMRDKEVQDLRQAVLELTSRLSKVETQFPEGIEIPQVTERKIPVKEAKPLVQTYIKKYLRKHRNVYPSDVADHLGLRYETVRAVFDVLESEGKLKMCK